MSQDQSLAADHHQARDTRKAVLGGCVRSFDKELHRFPTPAGERLVYVTSGTGMVGLPMRFLMPPRVDILTIHMPE